MSNTLVFPRSRRFTTPGPWVVALPPMWLVLAAPQQLGLMCPTLLSLGWGRHDWDGKD